MRILYKYLLVTIFAFISMKHLAIAQQYEERKHPSTLENMLVGEVNLGQLENYDGFENLITNEPYEGNPQDLQKLQLALKDIEIKVYIGTWCSDSQYNFPMFVNLLKNIDFPINTIEIIALDDEKKLLNGEMPGNEVEYVPTFLFFKDGMEKGRIVESPSEDFLKDILQILQK